MNEHAHKVARIREMLEAGKTRLEVRDAMHLTRIQLEGIIKRNDLLSLAPGARLRGSSDAIAVRTAKLQVLLNQGYSWAQIAAKFTVTKNVINSWIVTGGLTRSKPSEGWGSDICDAISSERLEYPTDDALPAFNPIAMRILAEAPQLSLDGD